MSARPRSVSANPFTPEVQTRLERVFLRVLAKREGGRWAIEPRAPRRPSSGADRGRSVSGRSGVAVSA